jgi:hypothetical protein
MESSPTTECQAKTCGGEPSESEELRHRVPLAHAALLASCQPSIHACCGGWSQPRLYPASAACCGCWELDATSFLVLLLVILLETLFL